MKLRLLLPLLVFFAVIQTANAQKITHSLRLTNGDTQCLEWNQFCLVDSIFPINGIPLKSVRYLFDDGQLITFNTITDNVLTFCKIFTDPAGGSYGLTVEITDTANNMIRQRYFKLFWVINCTDIRSFDHSNAYRLLYLSDQNAVEVESASGMVPQLYDMQGKQIDVAFTDQNGHLIICLDELSKGMYTLMLVDPNTGKQIPLKLICQ